MEFVGHYYVGATRFSDQSATVHIYSNGRDVTSNQSLNARGQAIHYAYDANGQLRQKTFADGSHVDYAYDNRGNLRSATDATLMSSAWWERGRARWWLAAQDL